MKWLLTSLPVLLLLPGAVRAQSLGPVVDKGSLTFTYTVNDPKPPASQTLKVTLPAAVATLPLVVTVPNNWLTLNSLTGFSPLSLTVSVNTTGLAPGSYSTSFSIDTNPARIAVTVAVTLVVQNPPPTLLLTSPTPAPYFAPPAAGSTSPSLHFTYTTGQGATTDPAPLVPPACSMELDVSSTGGIIPFTVTTSIAKGTGTGGGGASTVWIRVNGNGQLPTLQTSGVANTGSYAPICVTVDLPSIASLDDGPYTAQIDIKAGSAVAGAYTILVNLVISAGPPVVTSIYPGSLPAKPAVDPVFNVYGFNFFKSSIVKFNLGTNSVTVQPTFINRTTLQVSLDKARFTPAFEGSVYPAGGIPWLLEVYNTVPSTNPAQSPSAQWFYITDPTLPAITSVVNAASYRSTSVFGGTGVDPNPVGNPYPSTVAPREIISIFGQNLGALTSATATALNLAGATAPPPVYYPTAMTVATGVNSTVTVAVDFMFTPPPGSSVIPPIRAPLVMISNNQINAVVPYEVAEVLKTATHTTDIYVTVTNTVSGVPTTSVTVPLTATVLAEDPGIFTFSGLGSGQAAAQNQDFTINGTVNAKKSSVIQIFATGFGELSTVLPEPNGLVATTPITVKDGTVRVEMSGQPSVVTYAGTSPGSVDGLVQINVVVPLGAGTDCKVPLTAWIGDAATAHRSQGSVTLCVSK